MIDSNAYRPGDIINSMAGKSIYIKSTDAEGRLTLVDAITYSIRKLKVKKIIDIATLTGSQIHALGSNVSGALSNNDELFKSIQFGADKSDELIWRMPNYKVYKKLIEHKEADLTNSTSEAGMIGAGMFIGEFVENLPWVHIDIAGPSYLESASGYKTFGATGVGARTLYYLAKELSI
jgi:leucyl aminopeptidase